MANKKMLIDSSHPEETRVAVIDGSRLNEFDFESAARRQLRGNIYLAKVTRVEPSLQAAFVDYGGNRHGFLAFSEIHPDYYQIPVADREALLEEENRLNREMDAEDDSDGEAELSADEAETPQKPKSRRRGRRRRSGARQQEDAAQTEVEASAAESKDAEPEAPAEPKEVADADSTPQAEESTSEKASDETQQASEGDAKGEEDAPKPKRRRGRPRKKPDIAEAAIDRDEIFGDADDELEEAQDEPVAVEDQQEVVEESPSEADEEASAAKEAEEEAKAKEGSDDTDKDSTDENVESVGAEDALEEVPVRRRSRAKSYKIQEVIKRRQIILVQVVKEERGNKGAALTTYLSLAGRYSVLMPNSDRGGGISRKITNVSDRKRLKQIAHELDVAQGMGVILRTAGAARTKTEIRRDFEYLLRLWENVRSLTLESEAPTLVYEEGSLIKRAIRDLYSKDIDEIQVSGEQGYKEAKDFMRMLMPSHARNVKEYKADKPIFSKYKVENELDSMFSPRVTLKSGGYLIINPTEALVSIDVNSGKATREHSIEDTALQTNLEAAAEVARQLKLRDMAGLIVIDFIDMEENRNNRAVERRLKECLKTDRARIQVGRISSFGLLEMSRQRLRSGVLEGSTTVCPHCEGTGVIRSTESVALRVLRALDEQLQARATHDVMIKASQDVALYLLNSKRDDLSQLETRFGLQIHVSVQLDGLATAYSIERIKTQNDDSRRRRTHVDVTTHAPAAQEADNEGETPRANASDEGEGNGRRRRRRRRGGRNRQGAENGALQDAENALEAEVAAAEGDVEAQTPETSAPETDSDKEDAPKRRRGRRGGRRRRAETENTDIAEASSEGEEAKQSPKSAPEEEAVAEPEQTEAPEPEQVKAEAPKPVSNEIVVSSSGEADKEPPKKAGWWQRNILGK